MADHIILSQRAQAIVRLTLPPTGATLEEFTPHGVQQIELDDAELRAFLRALPLAVLRAVLAERTPWDHEFAAVLAPTTAAASLRVKGGADTMQRPPSAAVGIRVTERADALVRQRI